MTSNPYQITGTALDSGIFQTGSLPDPLFRTIPWGQHLPGHTSPVRYEPASSQEDLVPPRSKVREEILRALC